MVKWTLAKLSAGPIKLPLSLTVTEVIYGMVTDYLMKRLPAPHIWD